MDVNTNLNFMVNSFVGSNTGLDSLKNGLKGARQEITRLNQEMDVYKRKQRETSDPAWKTRNQQKIDGTADQIAAVKESMGPMQEQIDKYITTRDAVAKEMRMQKLSAAELDKGAGKILKSATANKKLKTSYGQLIGPMLSTMFFGMALQRVMQGLLQPAAQAAGIFDIWGTVLLVTFLPVMLAILPYLLQFMDFMLSLDPSIQKAIGVIVIIAAALGGLLMMLGQLALFISGGGMVFLSGMFTGMSTAISGVVAVLGGAFLPILAIVLAAIIGIVLAWKENWGNIRM